MPSIFEKLGHSLANIRDSYHFSVPSRAMRENNMNVLSEWLVAIEPDYEEVTSLFYASPNVESATTLGRHLRKHYTQDYRKLLDTYTDHAFNVYAQETTDLTTTRSGLLLLGLLGAMSDNEMGKKKPAQPLGQPEGFLSFEQELKLMQLSDERAYRTATESAPPVKHFVDYSPLLDLDATSFGRFCRIGAGRHAGLSPEAGANLLTGPNLVSNPAYKRATASLRSNVLNSFADNLITSPTPRYDLVEAALAQKLFSTEEIIFAVGVHNPQHLGKPIAALNSATEIIGARLKAKNQVIDRFATPGLCLKEAGKLTFAEQLDPAYRKKLNEFYKSDPAIASGFTRQPKDLVRHLDGQSAELSDISSITTPQAQFSRILTALKASDAPQTRDKFCTSILNAMQPSQPLHGLVEAYGHKLWESLTSNMSHSYREAADMKDKNWRFHLAQNMGSPDLEQHAARSVAYSSISAHYDLLQELVEVDNVDLISKLCERDSNKPRNNTTVLMLLGELAHIAHRTPLVGKIISPEMLDTVVPRTTPSDQEEKELTERLEESNISDKILDNMESSIPSANKVAMLGVLLRNTGININQEALGDLLNGNSEIKSQLLVQLIKHGSFDTRKNLLISAANCPDEALQETIVDEVLTRPLSLEEKDLDKFNSASPRTREMLEKASAAEQLTLPKNMKIHFGGCQPDM